MEGPLENLLKTYHELNAAVVDELLEQPSPLQFMRYVTHNRPFVVRNAASDWHAVNRWNANYLQTRMDGQVVQVAVTPKG